jgi:predicted SnoaL-like aldol condensation-catalyzing enzyme
MKRAAILAVILGLGMISRAEATPPVAIPQADQAKLLESSDPQLAANKKLCYDMYRVVLQAGQWQRAKEFIAKDYIQHNPNVVNGRDALEKFVQGSRPELPVQPTLKLPLISIVAERDRVVLSFVRTLKDADGNTYYSTWFDMFRIKDGKIAEHWDPAEKSADALKFNPNTNSLNK